MLTALLFRLARARPVRGAVSWIIAHMSFAIPIARLRETRTLIAFRHPQPVYPVHILLVPKRALSGLPALGPQDADFLVDLAQTVQGLVAELGLERAGYRLIANGGAYQEIPHLHFHLVSGEPVP